MFEGLTVAMVTPFRDGAVDLEATARLVELHARRRRGGPGGVGLDRRSGDLHRGGAPHPVAVRPRAGAWPGVPSWPAPAPTRPPRASRLTRMAEELELDGVMLVTPYYNKPTPKGQVAHFSTVARSTRLPVIALQRARPHRHQHDCPRRAREARRTFPTWSRSRRLRAASTRRARSRRATRFTLLSGDDSLTLPMIAVGAPGRDLGRRQRGAARHARRSATMPGPAESSEAEAAPPEAGAAVSGRCSSSRIPGRSSTCSRPWG